MVHKGNYFASDKGIGLLEFFFPHSAQLISAGSEAKQIREKEITSNSSTCGLGLSGIGSSTPRTICSLLFLTFHTHLIFTWLLLCWEQDSSNSVFLGESYTPLGPTIWQKSPSHPTFSPLHLISTSLPLPSFFPDPHPKCSVVILPDYRLRERGVSWVQFILCEPQQCLPICGVTTVSPAPSQQTLNTVNWTNSSPLNGTGGERQGSRTPIEKFKGREYFWGFQLSEMFIVRLHNKRKRFV